jgi:hypothetical protein
MVGRRRDQGRTCSNCSARRNRVYSAPERAMKCSPTGRLSAVQCKGADMARRPPLATLIHAPGIGLKLISAGGQLIMVGLIANSPRGKGHPDSWFYQSAARSIRRCGPSPRTAWLWLRPPSGIRGGFWLQSEPWWTPLCGIGPGPGRLPPHKGVARAVRSRDHWAPDRRWHPTGRQTHGHCGSRRVPPPNRCRRRHNRDPWGYAPGVVSVRTDRNMRLGYGSNRRRRWHVPWTRYRPPPPLRAPDRPSG